MAEGDPTTFLKKKIGGLPVGIWLLIVVVGIGVGLYIRNKAVDTSVDEEGLEDAGDGADVVPIEDLPSEDSGYWPMTGGGPPSVFGGGALRLSPDTLRIKLIYPKKKKKKNGGKKHHPNPDGGPRKDTGSRVGKKFRDRNVNAFNANGRQG
jgi:hypothetical protein